MSIFCRFAFLAHGPPEDMEDVSQVQSGLLGQPLHVATQAGVPDGHAVLRDPQGRVMEL